MAHPHTKFDDHRMETMMGRLLQIGVLLASAVVLVGEFCMSGHTWGTRSTIGPSRAYQSACAPSKDSSAC
jgi:hypothetical protein